MTVEEPQAPKAPAKARALRPRDAATLIIVDNSSGEPRVLLGRRRLDMVFMPGRYVFPGGRVEVRLQQAPEPAIAVRPSALRNPVVHEARLALLGHQARILEEPEMARDARLRDAEDSGELGDVEALVRERAQQAQARRIGKEAEQR